LATLRPASAGMASTTAPSPAATHGASSATAFSTRLRGISGVDRVCHPPRGAPRVARLAHAAVDDQVLVGEAHAEPLGSDVAEDGPDLVPGTAHGAAVARPGSRVAHAARQ